jgi:hypothetical protein
VLDIVLNNFYFAYIRKTGLGNLDGGIELDEADENDHVAIAAHYAASGYRRIDIITSFPVEAVAAMLGAPLGIIFAFRIYHFTKFLSMVRAPFPLFTFHCYSKFNH